MERLVNKLAAPVQDSWFMLKTVGWREAAQVFAKEVGQLFFYSAEFVLMTRRLENLSDIPKPSISVELRQGTSYDIDKLGHLVSPSRLGRFRQLVRNDGIYCFMAVYKDTPIACSWVSTWLAPERARFHLPLASAEVYVHNSYTAADYQRRGIMSALITYRNVWLYKNEFRRVFTLILVSNAASLSIMRKLGFQDIDRVKHRRILWRETKQTQNGNPLQRARYGEELE